MRKSTFIITVFFAAMVCTTLSFAQPGVISAIGFKLTSANTNPGPSTITLYTQSQLPLGSTNYSYRFPAPGTGIFKSDASGIINLAPVNLASGDVTGALPLANIALPTNNIIIGNSSGLATAVAPGAVNTVLTINGSGVPSWQAPRVFKRKATAQTFIHNAVGTSRVDDADLFFTVGANEAYEFEVLAFLSIADTSVTSLSAATEAGIKLSAAASEAAFIVENLNVSTLGITGSGVEGVQVQSAEDNGDHFVTFAPVVLAINAMPISEPYVKIKGFVRAGTSSTTVTVRWGEVITTQVGAGRVRLAILANSYLKATRVD